MPNWCENDIWIRGTKHDVDEYVAKYTTDGVMDFDKIIPMPKEFLDDDRWWAWRIDNWGTKWNINKESGAWDWYGDEGDYTITGTFDTAWSPPLEVLHRLSELCPDLTIEIVYDESGEEFQGNYIFSAGAIEEVYHRTGDDYISKWGDEEEEE